MKTSKLIIRIHGTFLILATISLTVVGWISYCCGKGLYGDMLLKEPIGYIGLFQGYLLMTTIGITLWAVSFGDNPDKFHWLGIGAHIAPFAANFIFWTEIENYGIPHSGIFFHLAMMILEAFGVLKSNQLKNFQFDEKR